MPGVNQIYYNNEWRSVEPYIYHNGTWKMASTNIFYKNKWEEFRTVPMVFFKDGEAVDGIVWDRNFYKIPSGADEARTNYSDKGMHEYSYIINSYANRSTPVFIPSGVTKLKVKLYYYIEYSGFSLPTFQIGFLKNEKEVEMTDSSKGQLSSTDKIYFSNIGVGHKDSTFELKIDDNLKNSNEYRIVINYLGSNAGLENHLYINSVWFE